jgi:phage antirepressor YoqD-like protein
MDLNILDLQTQTNQNNDLIPIVNKENLCLVDSRIIANYLGIGHKPLIASIRKHLISIESDFGKVHFEKAPSNTGSKQKQTVVFLTEDQAIFITTLSRNNVRVVEFKSKLVKSFQRLRKNRIAKPQPRSVLIANALVLAQEEIEEYEKKVRQQAKQIQVMKPKEEYHDRVLQAIGTYTITEIAKELGTSAKRLNDLLKSKKIQYYQYGKWMLYSKYAKKGFIDYKTHIRNTQNGEFSFTIMVWTEIGKKFVHQVVKQYANDLPTTTLTTFSNH